MLPLNFKDFEKYEYPSIENPCINLFPKFLFAIVVTSSPLYKIYDSSDVVVSEKIIKSSLTI